MLSATKVFRFTIDFCVYIFSLSLSLCLCLSSLKSTNIEMWPAFYALQRIHHPISNCGPAVRVVRIGSVQVAISNNLKSSLSIFFSCLRESLTVSFPFLHAQQFRQFHALCVLSLFLSLFSSLFHIPANFAMPKAISCAGRPCAQL